MLGVFELSSDCSIVPDGGLGIRFHRVELVEEHETASAWIAELEILGDLPFHKGERRDVRVRIMSDEFRLDVEARKPDLLVQHGSDFVGSLVLI